LYPKKVGGKTSKLGFAEWWATTAADRFTKIPDGYSTLG
jgi:hypothetical protein